jgi:type IV pilus assembly protein PilM
MPKFLELKPESFGLDISDSSLKVVKLKKKGKNAFSLASLSEEEFESGIIEDGVVKDEEILKDVIKKVISNAKGEKIRTENVVCSLPEEKSFLEVIKMPKMKEEDLKNAVRYEAENYIPMSVEEVYLDSQILRPAHGHLEYAEVLVVACPKEIVDPYISCLKKADLQPRVLEIESLAIARALIENEVVSQDVLLIDIGAHRTSFIIFSGYSLRFTSSISVSGQGLTKVIAEKLSTELEKAEKIKIKYGLRGKTKKGTEVIEALSPSLQFLVDEISKYLNFYKTHGHGRKGTLPANKPGIEKIILCGGGANLIGLTDYLNDKLKIPVELGNPWVNIFKKPKQKIPLVQERSIKYATAIGLALRGIREKI